MTPTVQAGFVTRPRGLAGEVEIRLFLAGRAVALPRGFEALVGDRAVTVERSSIRSADTVTALFTGLESIEAVDDFRGEAFSASRESVLAVPGFRPLALFLGMRVEWQDGAGIVEDFEPFSANPLLSVGFEGRRFDVPLLLITETGSIDWEGGRIGLRLPAGLVEGVD